MTSVSVGSSPTREETRLRYFAFIVIRYSSLPTVPMLPEVQAKATVFGDAPSDSPFSRSNTIVAMPLACVFCAWESVAATSAIIRTAPSSISSWDICFASNADDRQVANVLITITAVVRGNASLVDTRPKGKDSLAVLKTLSFRGGEMPILIASDQRATALEFLYFQRPRAVARA